MKVWDASAGANLRTLEHASAVSAVALSDDGRTLVASTGDSMKVWDVHTGKEKHAFAGLPHHVDSVALLADGRLLATGSSSDGTVRVWDMTTGKEQRRLQSFQVSSVAFSPDGRHLLASGLRMKLWDVATGQEALVLEGNKARITVAAFSPDGRRIAAGSDWDGLVTLWDVATGQELLALKGHKATITGVAFSPDGKRLVSSCWDHTLKVWEAP